MHHEVGAEEVGPISASAIPLAGAGKVELHSLQKVVLDMESRIERILRVCCHESAEKIRTHSRMQILADLQRDLDFFGERRRNVLSNLVFRSIETRQGHKFGGRSEERRVGKEGRSGC